FLLIKTQHAKDNFANCTGVIRRNGQQAGDLRSGVCCPGRVAANRHHDRAAFLPERRLQLFHQLNFAEAAGLLHRQRTAIREGAKDSRTAVAVTKLGIERDDLVRLGFEIREIRPRQLELDLQPVSSPTRGAFDSAHRNSYEIAGEYTIAALHIRLLETCTTMEIFS